MTRARASDSRELITLDNNMDCFAIKVLIRDSLQWLRKVSASQSLKVSRLFPGALSGVGKHVDLGQSPGYMI